MPKNVTNVAKSLTVFIFTAPLGGKCNAVLHVMHYIFESKCTAILSNAVQFSKCTATCNALHSTSLVQYSDCTYHIPTDRACISGVTSWSYKLTRNTSKILE